MLLPVGAIGVSGVTYSGQKAAASADVFEFSRDASAFRRDNPEAIVPDPILARSLWSEEYGPRCHVPLNAEGLAECNYGKLDGERTLVVHGGSHSTQWLRGLMSIAEPLDLRLVQITKVGCPSFDPSVPTADLHPRNQEFYDTRDASCLEWNRASQARILDLEPDAVLTVGTRGTGEAEELPEAAIAWAETIGDAGIQVLVLRDNPRLPIDVPACVDRNRDDPSQCNVPRDTLLSEDAPGADLDVENLTYVDLTEAFCGAETCWAVKDGILIYRDGHHLTGTYAEAIVHKLGQRLFQVLATPPIRAAQGPSQP